jgi:hypothetical protein
LVLGLWRDKRYFNLVTKAQARRDVEDIVSRYAVDAIHFDDFILTA